MSYKYDVHHILLRTELLGFIIIVIKELVGRKSFWKIDFNIYLISKTI